MIKRKYTTDLYRKIGSPDLGDKMYVMQGGKKVWGSVALLSLTGFKDARKGYVLLGVEPFKRITNPPAGERQISKP